MSECEQIVHIVWHEDTAEPNAGTDKSLRADQGL